jgi:hypothetical protein
MPLIFVHGVATRQSPQYQAAVAQRDALFKRLVIGEGEAVLDPDWGSGGVKFKGGWVPDTGAAEPFSFGAPVVTGQGPSAAAVLASRNVERGIDLAFSALLARNAATDQPLSEEQLRVFEAAVRYLETGGDRTAFAATDSDSQFADALRSELKPLLTTTDVEPMGLGDVFSLIGNALKAVTDPLRNASSDAVLKLIRKPLSDQAALFLGDIFVYLRWRESDKTNGTYNRILEPIVRALVEATKSQRDGEKMVVVGHSLGAVILYDLLTDERALAEIKAGSGKALTVDAWLTVGAQPGVFADMGLYDRQPGSDGRLPSPKCARRWMNVYDLTDVLSFRAEPFFSGVTDYEFDNVVGALEAHSSYFLRPSFYKRLRSRLSQP